VFLTEFTSPYSVHTHNGDGIPQNNTWAIIGRLFLSVFKKSSLNVIQIFIDQWVTNYTNCYNMIFCILPHEGFIYPSSVQSSKQTAINPLSSVSPFVLVMGRLSVLCEIGTDL